MSDNQAGKETRWWEYYFVRYFVGSVAGAVAIVALSNLPGLGPDRLGIPLAGGRPLKPQGALGGPSLRLSQGWGWFSLASAQMDSLPHS